MARRFFELMRFSLSSLSGFVVDYLMYVLLLSLLGADKLVCVNVGARLVSGTVNFTLNRLFVFDGDEEFWRSAGKYAVLALCILGANTAILMLLTGILGMNRYLAKVLTELTLYLVNWLVQRTIVFRRKRAI